MEKQEKQAIEILHMMCGNNGCVISDSGGKDSSVLKHIALKVKNRYGLEYKIRHNHTTVDAPETVYFIRREKEKYEAMGVPYEIFYPAQSMWQLIVSHGTPPTRIMRYTIKSSMRILSKSAVIEQDINNSIAACKLDLQLAGVVNINENDALIIRAVTLFVKAEFNYQNAADRYKQSYEALKMSLCLAGDYNTKEG